MLVFALSILTIFVSVTVIGITTAFTGYLIDEFRAKDYQSNKSVDILLHFSMAAVLLGIAVAVFNGIGLAGIATAWENGWEFGSQYALHIPTSSDFWEQYVPLWFDGVAIQNSYQTKIGNWILYIGLALTIVALIFVIRAVVKNTLLHTVRSVFSWQFIYAILAYFFLYYLSSQIVLFLIAYILGSALFLGQFWWVPFVVLLGGAMVGGKTAIYDASGNKIGEIDRY